MDYHWQNVSCAPYQHSNLEPQSGPFHYNVVLIVCYIKVQGHDYFHAFCFPSADGESGREFCAALSLANRSWPTERGSRERTPCFL